MPLAQVQTLFLGLAASALDPRTGIQASLPSPPADRSLPTVARPPASLGLSSFYEKFVDAGGLPVVSSGKVPDRALLAAREIVCRMLETRPDVGEELARSKVRVVVMATSELTTDVPEHADLAPKAYWDRRARGLGANRRRPATSCGEENLLGYAKDRYAGESILVHEFAHTIHKLGLKALDRSFDERLRRIYGRAMEAGRFERTYAATDPDEYWAEGVQTWFDANLESSPPDGIHNEVDTREELGRYDPELASLVAEAFRGNPWRWRDPRSETNR